MFIVLNCGSGSHDMESTRTTVSAVLDAAGREHHFHEVADAARLPAIAREVVGLAATRSGIVVAAGGDGTINAVAQAAMGSRCVLGVLPHGTFNYFCRTHGIPEDVELATRLLLAARARPVQVGLVNGKVFVVNASIGLYPRLLEDRETLKRQFGRSRLIALWAAGLTMLREYRQIRLAMEHDGELHAVRTPTLFIGNNRLQLERIGIPEAPEVEQGKLVAVTPRAGGMLALLWLTLQGLFGRLGEAGEVTSFAFGKLSVKRMGRWRKRRIKVSTDGELNWLEAPLVFSVAPDPLFFLMPDGDPSNDATV